MMIKKFSKDKTLLWNWYLHEVRSFFYERAFLEVKTPLLVTNPGSEPSLDVFQTELKVGSKTKALYLPTSPELHLKKALCRGAENIFEITSSFRNGEITERHQPEFQILEWYRAGGSLRDIQQDCVELVGYLYRKANLNTGRLGSHQFQFPKCSDLETQILELRISDLFKNILHFDFKPDSSAQDLSALASQLNIDVHAAGSIDDLFYLIFMDKLEFKWPKNQLCFIRDYPPYQAALAEVSEQGWAKRFELYWQGYEIANAFQELTDPDLQVERFKEDNQKKSEMGKGALPLDEDFISHLRVGMPRSAGIALGLERLFMAMFGFENIASIHNFPYEL